MKATPVVGQVVQLYVSDPWEFGTECGVGPFVASIVDAGEASLLLSLASPISYRGEQLRSVLVKPRHASAMGEAIQSSEGLAANCALLRVQLGSQIEIDDAAKMGMVPVIGSVRIAR